ncbi:YbjN domain-containing protein [uncultured Gammaproteobacteria bacterium]
MSATTAHRIESLTGLADLARTALPLGLGSISVNSDGVLGVSERPRESKLRFSVEGLLLHVLLLADDVGSGARCQVWAEVGHVPYTAQSSERRRGALAVLRGASDLSHARFVVESGQKILINRETHLPGPVVPEDLIMETVLLIQEVRPFLRLLLEFL